MRMARTSALRVMPSVTPLLGIMLALLIIFMVLVPAYAGGFDIDVPMAQHVHPYAQTSSDRVLGIESRWPLLPQ